MIHRFYEYEKFRRSTDVDKESTDLIYPTRGLNRNAGEVAEKVKKVIRDKGGKYSPDDRIAIAFELGDVLWYLTCIANRMGYSLNAIADMNIYKLKPRQDRGVLHGSGDNR